MITGLQFFSFAVSARLALMLSALVLCAASSRAQAGFSWQYAPRALGASDIYGYASWGTPLGVIALNGASIPLRAEFLTDPRPAPAPSPIGRGWSIPFFSSALIEENQDTLRWHRPDGRVFYFIRQRGVSSSRQSLPNELIEFLSVEGSWLAKKESKKRYYQLIHKESGAELIYEDGVLVKFCLVAPSENAKTYTISYNQLRRPVKLALHGSGQVIVEFVYDNAKQSKQLRIGDALESLVKTVDFKYSDVALNQFDTGPYLSKIDGAVPMALVISYSPEKTDANRIRVERSGLMGETSLVWDARSGFIREDDSSIYEIENSSLVNSGRLPSANSTSKQNASVVGYNWRPEEAKIKKIDRDGKFEFRFYDRNKGTLTQITKNGRTTITSYLLTLGPMHGKVRKVVSGEGAKLSVTLMNSYDEFGRLVRQIDNAQNTTSIWEYGENTIRHYLNSSLVEERLLAEGRVVGIKNFREDGVYERIYDYSKEKPLLTYVINGDVKWTKPVGGN